MDFTQIAIYIMNTDITVYRLIIDFLSSII